MYNSAPRSPPPERTQSIALTVSPEKEATAEACNEAEPETQVPKPGPPRSPSHKKSADARYREASPPPPPAWAGPFPGVVTSPRMTARPVPPPLQTCMITVGSQGMMSPGPPFMQLPGHSGMFPAGPMEPGPHAGRRSPSADPRQLDVGSQPIVFPGFMPMPMPSPGLSPRGMTTLPFQPRQRSSMGRSLAAPPGSPRMMPPPMGPPPGAFPMVPVPSFSYLPPGSSHMSRSPSMLNSGSMMSHRAPPGTPMHPGHRGMMTPIMSQGDPNMDAFWNHALQQGGAKKKGAAGRSAASKYGAPPPPTPLKTGRGTFK